MDAKVQFRGLKTVSTWIDSNKVRMDIPTYPSGEPAGMQCISGSIKARARPATTILSAYKTDSLDLSGWRNNEPPLHSVRLYTLCISTATTKCR
jgi:hypothetical protein